MLHLTLRQIRTGKTGKVVTTLREASEKFRAYTEGKRASSLSYNAGLVTDGAGKPVAVVSFNGRVWDAFEVRPGCWTSGSVEITGAALDKVVR